MTSITCGAKGTILYFSNCNSYHTQKWAGYMSNDGFDVHVASLEPPHSGEMKKLQGVTVHWLRNPSLGESGSDFRKIAYLSAVGEARKVIRDLSPDIIHAHRVPSNGLVCALACGRRPYYLSVWGNDIYEFPRKSLFHRILTQYSLSRCKWLMSTSKAMAEETAKYTSKKAFITPFGVDMKLFNPKKRTKHEGFVIGTVKSLDKKYGIDTLLKASSSLHDRRPDLGVRVRIAGTGPQENELRRLGAHLGMESYLSWLGFISQDEAAREWASFDIGVVPSESESESFGVSAVEAQASGTPLIITDIPGLMEACNGGHTAIVVQRRDIQGLSNAMERLADDEAKRESLSKKAREYVLENYDLDKCFQYIESIYRDNRSVDA